MIDLSPTQATSRIATLSSAFEIPVVRSYAIDKQVARCTQRRRTHGH